jgi:hypothetical protein
LNRNAGSAPRSHDRFIISCSDSESAPRVVHTTCGARPQPRFRRSHLDPIFAATDPRHEAAEAATARATDDLEEAGKNLADIEPTTTTGLLAMLAHVIDCIRQADDDGLDGDRFDGANWRLPHLVELDEEHFILRLLSATERNVRNLTGASEG